MHRPTEKFPDWSLVYWFGAPRLVGLCTLKSECYAIWWEISCFSFCTECLNTLLLRLHNLGYGGRSQRIPSHNFCTERNNTQKSIFYRKFQFSWIISISDKCASLSNISVWPSRFVSNAILLQRIINDNSFNEWLYLVVDISHYKPRF